MKVGAIVNITTNIGAVYTGVIDNINSAHIRIKVKTFYVIPWTIIKEVKVL